MEIIKITKCVEENKISMENTEMKDGRSKCFCKYSLC